jgi:16S rRNA (guanine527-N7)-methyltransferase
VNEGATAEVDLLTRGARDLGLELTAGQVDQLRRCLDLLERGNAAFNLTAIRERSAMLTKHVLDSLTAHRYLHGRQIADVGTGAGFPGVPLAIVNPNRQFALIEATRKKARFVDDTVRNLGLANVSVIAERAEQYQPAVAFDTVIARALSKLEPFLARAGHLCARDGRLLAMKGRRPDDELATIPRQFRLLTVHRVHVPGLDEERHIVELCPTVAGARIQR